MGRQQFDSAWFLLLGFAWNTVHCVIACRQSDYISYNVLSLHSLICPANKAIELTQQLRLTIFSVWLRWWPTFIWLETWDAVITRLYTIMCFAFDFHQTSFYNWDQNCSNEASTLVDCQLLCNCPCIWTGVILDRRRHACGFVFLKKTNKLQQQKKRYK